MPKFSRRNFLAGSAAIAGTGLVAASLKAAEGVHTPLGTDQVELGNTGLKLSALGIGTGTHGGNDQLALGTDGFTEMIRYALDRGITYLDTADMYNTHVYLRVALQGVPRDKYFIQTKTRAQTPETVNADVDRFIRVMQCKYIDTLLIHCMTSGDWLTTMEPVMEELSKIKATGKVKAVGVSCHGMPPLEASVKTDWCDVQLVRINPFGAKMDGTPEEVSALIRQMKAKGRGVIGMKIFGEGTLENAEQRYESLKWVLKNQLTDAFTIGFTSKQQIEEVLNMMEKAQKELA